MPRVTLPPTPASSTDIKGKDGTGNVPTLHLAFELPPPALTNDPRIVSPTETKPPSRTRRRSSATTAAASTKEKEKEFALPPPPTRSRKIIQMKPKAQDEGGEEPEGEDPDTSGSKAGAGRKAAAAAAAAPAAPASAIATTGGRGKKQPSATSAAGRKIARKTAHSLIERRRRSKMNEEFAVLKSMIPACTGEMHKLAILQASIEYVRYLEDCVATLKSQSQAQQCHGQEQMQDVSGPQSVMSDDSPIAHAQEGYGHAPAATTRHQLPYGDMSGDVEMAGASSVASAAPSPTYTNHQSSISPALRAEDSRRHRSYSSVSTDHQQPSQQHYGHGHGQHQQHFRQSLSATTSPTFRPQPSSSYANSYNRGATTSAAGSTLTSPALEPQRDLDHEATAALLMLNSDRRGFGHDGGGRGGFTAANAKTVGGSGGQQGGAGRGMSVRDLLST